MSASLRKLHAVPVFWCGPPPAKCDVCKQPIDGAFIDGRTVYGPWANMDAACHAEFGTGLGQGRGQKFVKQADGRFLKTAG
jgi:hypothetical protein